ncbi:hypothetical protein JCM17823_21130 [Halorubrum gandharaense]
MLTVQTPYKEPAGALEVLAGVFSSQLAYKEPAGALAVFAFTITPSTAYKGPAEAWKMLAVVLTTATAQPPDVAQAAALERKGRNPLLRPETPRNHPRERPKPPSPSTPLYSSSYGHRPPVFSSCT